MTSENSDNLVEGIPAFFAKGLRDADMGIQADRAVVVYEQGNGGEIKTVIGALIRPNETQSEDLPEMVWVLPYRDEFGKLVQSEDRAKMIQINRRYIIEIGSVVTKEDFE